MKLRLLEKGLNRKYQARQIRNSINNNTDTTQQDNANQPDLDQLAADAVAQKINQVSVVNYYGYKLQGESDSDVYHNYFSANDEDYIWLKNYTEECRKLYDSLTEDQKKLIDPKVYKILTDCEQHLKDYPPDRLVDASKVNYSNTLKELEKGRSDNFFDNLNRSGHGKAVNILGNLNAGTLNNFVKSIGINEISAWRLPFLKMLENENSLNVLKTNQTFTAAYNLLYDLTENDLPEEYIKQRDAIIYNPMLYKNVKNEQDVKELIKASRDSKYTPAQINDAINRNNYGIYLQTQGKSPLEKLIRDYSYLSKDDQQKAKDVFNKDSK